MSLMHWIVVLFLLIVVPAVNFIPTFVALARRHRNLAGIFVLNMFLGWTGIGWVIALIWAVRADAPPGLSATQAGIAP